MSDIAQNFFTAVDTTFVSFFLTSSARVAAAARPVFNTMVTIYVLLWGFSMWRGLIREPMSDGVMRVVKIVLIGTFALNAGVYGAQIAQALYRIPDQLAAVVIPGLSGAGNATALDNSIDRGIDVLRKLFAAVGAADGIVLPLALLAQAIVLALTLTAVIGYAFALVLLAKMGVSIALALGPLAIAGLLFKPTHSLFGGWSRMTLTFVFSYVVVALIVSLGLVFVDDAARATLTAMGDETPSLIDLLRMLIVGVALFVVLLQANAIAAGLAGGVQIGTLGAVGWTMQKAAGLATSPVSGWKSLRSWQDRRMARAYYKQRAADAGGAKSDAWKRGRLLGSNQVGKR